MNEKECRSGVRDRAGGLCERCGLGEGSNRHTVHHRRKRSAGGPWSLSNCVLLCGNGVVGCHGWVEAHPKLAMESGWWVSRYADECDVPVHRLGEWVLLLDDGGIEVIERDDD